MGCCCVIDECLWVLMSGWSSNSKYAFLGVIRAAAQMIVMRYPWG